MFGWRMFHPIVLMFIKHTCLFINKNHGLVSKKKKEPKEMLKLNNKESKKMKV